MKAEHNFGVRLSHPPWLRMTSNGATSTANVAYERCSEHSAEAYLGNCGTKHALWLRFLSAALLCAPVSPDPVHCQYSAKKSKHQHLEWSVYIQCLVLIHENTTSRKVHPLWRDHLKVQQRETLPPINTTIPLQVIQVKSLYSCAL